MSPATWIGLAAVALTVRIIQFTQRRRSVWLSGFFVGGILLLWILFFSPLPLPLYFYTKWPVLVALMLIAAFWPALEWGWLAWTGRGFLRKLAYKGGPVDELVATCLTLSQAHLGALIAIERRDDLTRFMGGAVPLEAQVRHETLVALFHKDAPTHDGGLIIRNGRLACCRALFPLSRNAKLEPQLGTRHRSAIGLSEVSDAVCLVVSEQTGNVSLAVKGKLHYGLPVRQLRRRLVKALKS